MKTLQEMRKLVEEKKAEVLTNYLAEKMKGKQITTFYYGYKGQDDVDCFVIGDVKREIYGNGQEGHICIFTDDGRNTFIRLHENEYYGKNGIFTCSDSDRIVYFIEG